MAVTRKRRGNPRAGAANQLRIIGGRWRGRRIDFPDAPGLRPTIDRVRETLFNWLQWALPGSVCLDLFAGSGALGLEAASRGAAEVVMIESAPQVAACLRENAARFGAIGVDVVNTTAQAYLQNPTRTFDIVFLDPPFAHDLLAPTLSALVDGGWLRPGAWVYLEYPADAGMPTLPPGLTLSRQQRAGQAAYALARWQTKTDSVADW
ncbi:16S rRNA (guanine(966)-N(2))-methyltransferase RsmD [Acidihalobacter yilgarnensis]|uniref:Ribosomal RNA small subunit methyltransferase D n=1 Tax=Acidihalobacter yilgarnensis TaxID=2819280 RepID=A0A1D8IJZ2_9GAMM|nr:16S rRNA (guanine(966)-N(2))-methyltransferase RsmD [Acidihalobacter yilgarnensis]AOU96788.1 16S rRNA (guanine(966)-N(2))-methyltransferase RsmD [Acidihalobacter yilgarnensis]